MPHRVTPITMPIVVMGVSGSGKTAVGRALANRLRVPFLDADDLHPAANVAKMAAGHPLDDADRWPWLDEVGRWLARHHDGGVAACSALSRAHRDRLRAHAPTTWFAYLRGPRGVIEARLADRRGHFMPAVLLDSQLAALEPPGPDESGMVLDLELPISDLVEEVVSCGDVPEPDS